MTFESHWQSGEFYVYVAMLLHWRAAAIFVPSIAFCMLSLSMWVFRPPSQQRVWVRLGLYTGVLLSFQFLLLILVATGWVTFVLAPIVGGTLAGLTWLLSLAVRQSRRYTILEILVATSLVAIVVAFVRYANFTDPVLELLQGSFIAILVAAPVLNFVTYARAARWIYFHASSPREAALPWWLLGWSTWLGAFAVSWRIAILRMYEEYAKLPTEPPDCYVSSAAAHGHAKLVRSRQILTTCGAVRINPQMQRLKFLEFVLQAGLPGTHRILRRVYNRIGPRLAALCAASRWFADATYLLLLPAEWGAELIRRCLSIEREVVEQIYRRETLPLPWANDRALPLGESTKQPAPR